MELRKFLIAKDIKVRLDEIAELICMDKLVRTLVRTSLEGFLCRCGVELKSYELTRLYKKPSSMCYEYIVYYHDFIISKNVEDLINQSNDEILCSKILRKIDTMTKKAREAYASSLSILHQMNENMDMESYVEPIPLSYLGRYIGYRRSANKNDIVRFTLDITETDNDKMVEYENDYIRTDLQWNAIGFGVSVKDTLYLIGHARSAARIESLGLRFMAIKQFGTDGTLIGLLISMDTNRKIIAARIVLVPREKHSFCKKYRDLDEDDFTAKIIEGTLQDQDILRDEILSQVKCLSRGVGPERLFDLIRNHAFSGLKLDPSEFDDDIGVLEGKIEEFAMRTGSIPRDIVKVALERYVKDVIDCASPL